MPSKDFVFVATTLSCWSNLNELKTPVLTGTPEDFAEEKRIKLFERISLFACLMGAVHFFLDLFNNTPAAAIVDLVISAVMLTCFIIHRKGNYSTARVAMLSI